MKTNKTPEFSIVEVHHLTERSQDIGTNDALVVDIPRVTVRCGTCGHKWLATQGNNARQFLLSAGGHAHFRHLACAKCHSESMECDFSL